MEVMMRKPIHLDEVMKMAKYYDSLIYMTILRSRHQQVMQTLHTRGDEVVSIDIDDIRQRVFTNIESERFGRNGGCFYCQQFGHHIAIFSNQNG